MQVLQLGMDFVQFLQFQKLKFDKYWGFLLKYAERGQTDFDFVIQRLQENCLVGNQGSSHLREGGFLSIRHKLHPRLCYARFSIAKQNL